MSTSRRCSLTKAVVETELSGRGDEEAEDAGSLRVFAEPFDHGRTL